MKNYSISIVLTFSSFCLFYVAAETEAASIDILVCGNCQSVFHFVEEFQEHKNLNSCEKADKTSLTSQVIFLRFIIQFYLFISIFDLFRFLQGSKKPQVWAFLIWKNSQQKAAGEH